MQSSIQSDLLSSRERGRKKFAVLIDPDKVNMEHLPRILEAGSKGKADFILCGGSLLTADTLDSCISVIKSLTTLPVILFPGNQLQVSPKADAILLLSLVSGRNPDLLIGEHVRAVYKLKASNLEIIPTAYMLIESGQLTSAVYMSHTLPIPRNKADIAAATAAAAEMLGMQQVYLDAGSGAKESIPPKMIKQLRREVKMPIWVGGGIRDGQTAYDLAAAGADVIVTGTIGEQNADKLIEIGQAIKAAEDLQLKTSN